MILSEKIYERIDGRSLELIFDIASGSVSGAFVYFQKNELPKIMYKKTEDIKISSNLDSGDFKKQTLIALNNVCRNLIESGAPTFEIKEIFKNHRNPKRAHVFFSSPWIDLEIKNLIFSKQKGDFENFLGKLIKDVDPDSKSLISRDINSLKINGYQVDVSKNSHDGLNEVVEDGEISYINSKIPIQDLNLIHGIIERNFSLENIFDYPFYKVLNDAIKSLYKIDRDFICIDLTSEVSDVYVTKNKEIALNFTVPFGRSKIYRSLVEKKFVDNISQAKTMLNAFASGHVNSGLGIKKIIKGEHEKFATYLKEGFSVLKQKDIPSDIFVIADRENTPFLRDFIKDHFSKINLVLIDKQKIIENIEVVEGNYDNFISLESLFVK